MLPLLGVILAGGLAISACGPTDESVISGGNTTPIPGGTPQINPAPPPPSAPARQTTTTPRPVVGSVPRALAGLWSGGPGDASGYLLAIGSDGTYQRARTSTGRIFEQGVLQVTPRGSWTFVPTSGGPRRTGTFEYTNASGIEVLSMNDPREGYFSYVRADGASGSDAASDSGDSAGSSSSSDGGFAGQIDGGSDPGRFDPTPPAGPYTPG
ncbi:hypothetical protein [Actinomycetospora cinnamomea]|uniref:hypothetical protein n=1 Tax=Actinomycetospora cinnamomea TaxID=663609 RepID=UPI0010577F10|nr:hypothetical protein [Actinomycetospora cinnamomea]